MAKNISTRFLVSGRVQGVWFRASAKEEAEKLAITGWAKNLPDGRVEVLATGSSSDIKKFHTWLCKGPDLARVDDVLVEDAPLQEFDRFSIE